MKTSCEIVIERVALGEALGEFVEHAADCAACKRLVALPAELAGSHREVDPGLGFAARITAGAQHRVAVRRRRRVAAGLAAAVAVTALGVFAITREPNQDRVANVPRETDPPATDRKHDQPNEPAALDEDVAFLVHAADVGRTSKLSANWPQIQKPLRPYRLLVKGIER